jgi:hypothetical protein
MARRRDLPTHRELTENVDRSEEDLREQGEEIERTVRDGEVIRETMDSLDLSGTEDGADSIEQYVDSAEDVTVEEFESESHDLEGIQDENEEGEEDLHERSDTTSSDLGKLSSGSMRLHRDGANREFLEAKEVALRDIEFLDDQGTRAREAREESERLQQEHLNRLNAARRQ